VHSRHRQGGSSAHRFERHREKQIESFFTRVCGHAQEHLEPYLKQLDHVIYGWIFFSIVMVLLPMMIRAYGEKSGLT
jgi:hypothetical protein